LNTHTENLSNNMTYIIAEMACSHEGDPELAVKIIDGAGRAGADAIQFQIWSLPDMVVPHHKDYALLSKIELSQEQWQNLAVYVREKYPSMDIIACVYEAKSVDFALAMGTDAFKIHSADLSNPHFINHVASTGKRIDLSVGASTLNEIQFAIEWIKNINKQILIWLMYGYQTFPTPTEAIHLNFIKKIKNLFELPVGYQDHSDGDSESGFFLPAAAVGMGVDCLEKHITHDRGFKGIDHQAALNPDEFKRFVAMVRALEAAKGVSVPRPFLDQELSYRKYSKKSIVVSRDIKKGTIIRESDLLYMRADKLGLPPDQAYRLLGKKTKNTIPHYHLIKEDDVK
jgi:N,N'-diacetyllegionaminate synthase